MLDFKKNYELN